MGKAANIRGKSFVGKRWWNVMGKDPAGADEAGPGPYASPRR